MPPLFLLTVPGVIAAATTYPAAHMQWTLWTGFVVFVLVMMVLDLYVVGRKNQAVPVRQALMWTGVCIALALCFAPILFWMYNTHVFGIGLSNGEPVMSGREASSIFIQGWLLEYSLSVDNLFVFAVIFRHFRVPAEHQHRALAWGIIAALILRGVMIGAGAILLTRFAWLIPAAGIFLIYTAWGMVSGGDDEFDAEGHWSARLVRKVWPLEPRFHGDKFFVHVQSGTGKLVLAMTPLFLVLVVINVADVIFALDSIPAVFGISRNIDAFLVFTSNVFAILGLRSLYFAIAALMGKFDRLKYALAFILAFIGVKMIAESLDSIKGAANSLLHLAGKADLAWDPPHIHVPSWVSLGVIVISLTAGVVASLMASVDAAKAGKQSGDEG